MIIQRIDGTTRVLGKSQGYLGLPIRDDVDPGSGQPCMLSSWEPTPEELEALNAGGKVTLRVLGSGHPPVMLYVEKTDAG